MRDKYLDEYYSFLRFPSVSTDDQYKEKLVQCADWLVNKLNSDRSANTARTYETSSYCLGAQ